MDNPKFCFFCCKSTSHDSLNNGEQQNDVNKSHPVNFSEMNCPITQNSVRQSVLQISQYLKVPRNKLAQLKENKSQIYVCEDCKEISDYLNQLCRNVEVTKMKIAYYLNLLTDRIVGIDNKILMDDENDKQQVRRKEPLISDLQKTIHQKCLLKVRKDEDNFNPRLHLRKCKIRFKNAQQNIVEEPNDDYPIKLEVNDHLKTEIDLFTAPDTPELHSCPFCNFTVNCGDQLEVHITNQHSEQFESYTTIPPCPNTVENPIPCRAIFTCDFCPMTFTSWSNKEKHQNAVHLSGKSEKEIKKCEICGAMIRSGNGNYARHKRVQHQTITKLVKKVTHVSQAELVTNTKRPSKNVIDKNYPFTCDYCPLTFKGTWSKDQHMKGVHLQTSKVGTTKRVTRCNICGAFVPYKHLAYHKKTRHNVVSNNVNVEVTEKTFQQVVKDMFQI